MRAAVATSEALANASRLLVLPCPFRPSVALIALTRISDVRVCRHSS